MTMSNNSIQLHDLLQKVSSDSFSYFSTLPAQTFSDPEIFNHHLNWHSVSEGFIFQEENAPKLQAKLIDFDTELFCL